MPAGQPMDPRAPERPTVAGLARKTERAEAQLDRRIGQAKPQREPVWVQPDSPGHAIGRAWLDTDSTADNP